MSESDKIKVIHAYLTKDSTSKDSAAFQQWLDSDPDNFILYQQVSKIWQTAVSPEPILFDHNHAYNKQLNQLNLHNKKLEVVSNNRNWYKIATSIAAVLTLMIAALFLFKGGNHTVKSGDFAQLHVLPDGSKAWLNKGATLVYEHFNSTERKVRISGNVFFEVTPDKNAPFMISTDKFDVKVVGTKFLVNTDQEVVAVKEGIVDVKNDKFTQRITKDQKIKLTADGEFEYSNTLFNSAELLWFNDDLIFKNTPFDQVVQDLSDNFNVNIMIPEKSTWSACTFTSGSLKTSSLDQILEILKLTYDLEYTRQKDNSIKLTSVKCK